MICVFMLSVSNTFFYLFLFVVFQVKLNLPFVSESILWNNQYEVVGAISVSLSKNDLYPGKNKQMRDILIVYLRIFDNQTFRIT